MVAPGHGARRRQRKASLVKAGKLDKAELLDGKKGKEWKLSFKNPTVTAAANHTGQ